MADPEPPGNTQALIVGISGPSSSGKTTLARLLQRIFCGVRLDGSSELESKARSTQGEGVSSGGGQSPSGSLNTFIIHEDDFYFPDDQIPYTTTPSGKQVQDWDTASAIDIPFLAQSLSYVREHGRLPPRLQSKEDQNEVTDSGVADEVVHELRGFVEEELRRKASSGGGGSDGGRVKKTIAFMEGFLLYAPPESISPTEPEPDSSGKHGDRGSDLYKGHAPLRPVHAQIHLPLFLPASYQNVKARREGRSGYVTLGPAPEPPTERKHTTLGAGAGAGTGGEEEEQEQIDLEKPDDRPPQNFWVDPPGYVDDVVWPRYVEDHAWLLIPQYRDGDGKDEGPGKSMSLVERFGDGTRVREDVGVRVAPGKGEVGMEVVLRWAVGEVLGVFCG